jgi:stage II sporulation protein AA (anti-sigma F factor antagonist)
LSHLRTFKLIERDLRPKCREIQVVGELDLAVAEELQEGFARAGECRHLLIGLERCEFIDSTGLAAILRAHYQFAQRGGRVVVYGPTHQVLRILSITGLTANGMVFESAEEALSALGG